MTPRDRAWFGERLRRLERRLGLILFALAIVVALPVGGMIPLVRAQDTGAAPPVPDALKGRDCRTDAGKADAAFAYIEGKYDPSDATVFGTDDRETFRVGFFMPHKRRGCTGLVRIADDCRLSEDLKCRFATE